MIKKKASGKRDNGSGQIYKDGKGYRVAVLIGYDSSTGEPLYKKERAASHEEAVETLKRLQRDFHAGKIASTKGFTVESFLASWLETIKATKAPSTFRQYAWLIKDHILPNLGKKALDKVTRKDVQMLLAAKAKQKVAARDKEKSNDQTATLSANTLRLIRAVLHAAYRDAIRDGVAARNPAELCDLPNVAARNARTTHLNADQAKRLLVQTDNSILGDLFAFLLYTGTRLGEATGLRWQDVELGSEPQVQIRGQLQREAGLLTYRATTKTNRDRPIPLTASMVNRLKGIRAARMLDGIVDPDGIVFLNSEGRRIDPKLANNHLKAACKNAGVPEVSPHKLRHTCASLLMAATNDIHAVQKILGHAKVTLTADLYSHASAETLRPTVDILSRLDQSHT